MEKKKKDPFFVQVANNQIDLPGPDKQLAKALHVSGTCVNPSDIRADLWGILDDIVRNGKIKDSTMEVEDFIEARKNMSEEYKIENGALVRYSNPYEKPYQLWYVQLATELIDFLVNDDISHIKRCLLCKTFFVQFDNRQNRKYCAHCSGKNKMTREQRATYQKDYRATLKRRETRKLENMIKDLMKKDNLTRDEAESWLKENRA